MARTYETNRVYELMFIVRPDMVEEEQDKLISTLESAVSSSGGKVKSMERMGKRRLAYTVRRFHDGIYILLTVEGGGALIHELERRLRVTYAKHGVSLRRRLLRLAARPPPLLRNSRRSKGCEIYRIY